MVDTFTNWFWRLLYWTTPRVVSMTLFKTAYRINPKLVPKTLRLRSATPVGKRAFIAAMLRQFDSNPEYEGVYATLDNKVIGVDDLPYVDDGDLDRILLNGFKLTECHVRRKN